MWMWRPNECCARRYEACTRRSGTFVRDDRSRLHDIIRAIDQIQAETTLAKEVFAKDPKLQVWVLYHLQVIGEACRSLTAEFVRRT